MNRRRLERRRELVRNKAIVIVLSVMLFTVFLGFLAVYGMATSSKVSADIGCYGMSCETPVPTEVSTEVPTKVPTKVKPTKVIIPTEVIIPSPENTKVPDPTETEVPTVVIVTATPNNTATNEPVITETKYATPIVSPTVEPRTPTPKSTDEEKKEFLPTYDYRKWVAQTVTSTPVVLYCDECEIEKQKANAFTKIADLLEKWLNWQMSKNK